MVGSPAFTAPEVLKGQPPTPASDVYGLGATLFCAITGHAAFERRSGEQVVAQFLRITSHPIPELREQDIPADVCAATIERAMAREPTIVPVYCGRIRRGAARSPAPQRLAPPTRWPYPPTSAREPRRTSPRRRDQDRVGQVRPETTAGRNDAATTGTPPAPSTRFRPPTPTRQLVERSRSDRLPPRWTAAPVDVIHAPAGFGKSTLAAQWREVLTERGCGGRVADGRSR